MIYFLQLKMTDVQLLHLVTVVFLVIFPFVGATDLTFDLADEKKECYHETFENGERAQLDFRVISGGNYDINVRLEGPGNEVLYQVTQQQRGNHVFPVTKSGVYTACFSNEFSTITHKLVYFVLRSGREESHEAAAHLAETSPDGRIAASLQAVRDSLAIVTDYQTHIRQCEARDRLAAEATAWHVSAWAAFETLVIAAVGIGQVVFIRSLFSARRSVRLPGST